MTFWFPENIENHNDLYNINGTSPYYHVSQSVFQALIPFGGYTPSAANPFPTKDWVLAQVAAGGAKAAYGRGGIAGFTVDNFLGVNTNGTYNGDVGFSAAPNPLVTNRNIRNVTDTDVGQSTWSPPTTFSVGFIQAAVGQVNILIDEFAWITVGQ